MNEIIVTENLTKEYIKSFNYKKEGISKEVTVALDGISFKIYDGEFISIMGPSGSGKSTFVNLISTIDTPTKGKIFINGKRTTGLKESELSKLRSETIGFVFQDFNLIDNLTISENISVPLKLSGIPLKEINERVLDVATKLNISEFLEKYPSECSGGQVQRSAIARALINNPKVIIADEPTGNLDSVNSKIILNIFRELNEKFGITILIVTHDPLTASYSKKTINIIDGKIDKSIERKDLNQRQYFDKILNLVSGEIDI